MSIETRKDSFTEGVVSAETALACLFRLGAQNGVYAEIGAVRRRNLIDGDTLPVARLVELAREFGLRAERVRLDWEALRNTPFSHPVLLLLHAGFRRPRKPPRPLRRAGPADACWHLGRFTPAPAAGKVAEFLLTAIKGTHLPIALLDDPIFIKGAGDYNNDGKSDILWQNSSGAVAVWEMNGSSVFGSAILANPGPTWHA
jgi:hypothetical protein